MELLFSRLRKIKIKYLRPWMKRYKEKKRYFYEYRKFKIRPIKKIVTLFNNNSKNYSNITLDGLRSAKCSNTIILLGSAPSINSITTEQWQHIKNFDSVGFNFWYLNDFVPTYYYDEPPKSRDMLDLHKKMIAQKGQKYDGVIYFIFDWFIKVGWHPRYSDKIFPKGIKILKLPQPIRKKIHKEITIQSHHFNDVSNKIGNKLINYRASISIILNLAYQMKYKNIILTGIDLNSNKYFYDDNPLMKSRIHLNKNRNQGLHSTTDYGDCHGIDNYLVAFNEFVLKPKQINLFVSNKKSILYPRIPFKSLDDIQN